MNEQTKREPQETLDFKLTKSTSIFSIYPPLEPEEEKNTMAGTALEYIIQFLYQLNITMSCNLHNNILRRS